MAFTLVSTWFKHGITYAPVFPVPFFERANTSLPAKIAGIVCDWTGDGFSHPFSHSAFRISSFRPYFSNSSPSTGFTSYTIDWTCESYNSLYSVIVLGVNTVITNRVYDTFSLCRSVYLALLKRSLGMINEMKKQTIRNQ